MASPNDNIELPYLNGFGHGHSGYQAPAGGQGQDQAQAQTQAPAQANPVNPHDAVQSLTVEELRRRRDELQTRTQNQRLLYSPTRRQLLSRFSVFCLIMNRTIASGIFKQPANILLSVGSTAGALVVTIAAGLIILCIVACWLELGLTVPTHYIFQHSIWQRVSTPRSGGDKNYLEYIYKAPRFLMTCIFAASFIIFGNLAGNAVQFGVQLTSAIHPECITSDCYDSRRAEILGWAVGVLTICALLNVATRSYAIRLNNAFAAVKVLFLIITALAGIIWGSQHGEGCRQINFNNPSGPLKFGDVIQGLFYALYPYTGYEQPFYVLAEVADPQRTFASATLNTMAATVVLFPLVNVGFFCAIPYTGNATTTPDNMGTALYQRLANAQTPATQVAVERAINVVLALFIFGNLLAQTYTASRVKQEIAKEGILPWSLELSTSSTTWLGRLGRRGRRDDDQPATLAQLEDHPEEAPIAATLLHWTFEVALVLGFGIPLQITTAYNLLTYIYTYVIVIFLGALTAGGLLYLKIDSGTSGGRGRRWREKSAWQPWFDPLPAVVAAVVTAFLVGAAFAPTSSRTVDDLPWYVEPLAGLGSVAVGVAWWLGLRFIEWKSRIRLEVTRTPWVVLGPDGDGVQTGELIERNWVPE